MSGLAIDLDLKVVRDEATPAAQSFIDGLRSKAGLHEAIGRRALNLTREHFIRIAGTRHDTAERLGAQPSGHWAQAAEKTTMKSTAEAATISINHPGIGRAAHDVDIYPEGMYLTIALIAAAYNQRARRVKDLFFVQPKGKDYALLGQRTGKRGGHAGDFGGGVAAAVTWWYLLVTHVHQKQDRSLLPSDDEYHQAMSEGVEDYLSYLGAILGGRDSKRGFKKFSDSK